MSGNVKADTNTTKQAREAFTKKTTQEMWDRNPDYAKFPAAACYNKGYTLADPAKIDGLRSAKFELGLLNTEFVPQSVLKFCDPANTRIASYDCMYIQGGNQFKTNSEGGYINVRIPKKLRALKSIH